MSEKTTLCLWFDGVAEEAARFYVPLLPDSHIDMVQKAPADYPGGKAGDVLVVAFTLAGRSYIALNGRRQPGFTDAFSIQVHCDTQDEIDHLWQALSAHPEAEQCGWCMDRFGLSWQIVPRRMPEWLAGPNGGAVQRTFMQMTKMRMAEIEAAARGEPT